MKAFLFAALSLLIFGFNTTTASAQNVQHYPIGQVVELEGEAFYAGYGTRKAIRVGDPIFLNSTLETGKSSKLLILLIDDTQIVLGENSHFQIDRYIFDPYEPEENEGRFNLLQGTLYWITGILSARPSPDVVIKTPVGAIGIRGTSFWAGTFNDGFGVYVDKGKVGFMGKWGEVNLPAGKGAFISATAPPDENYWNAINRETAYSGTRFKNEKHLQERVKQLKLGNIRKRHDYRGKAFPYKPNPFARQLKGNRDDFFSDEFEQLRQK